MLLISRLVYVLFLPLYHLAARLIAPFNEKARKWTDGRKNLIRELSGFSFKENSIWFHCSSLGEFEQALPLIQQCGNAENAHPVVVTFFSPSGYEIAVKKYPRLPVFYLPLDSRKNATFFLDKVKPRCSVFIRYDLWYYYLDELRQRNIPSYLVSAVFRQDDIFFRWHGALFRHMLRCFTHILTQDEHSVNVLRQNGFSQVTKAGDTRIDRVCAIRQQAALLPVVERFKNEKPLFIIGSLEPKDESIVLPALRSPRFLKEFKIIIAPHRVDKKYITSLMEKINVKTALYSGLDEQDADKYDTLVIDSIGMLSAMYRYADAAYIGGGFGEGLHNTLEPAAWEIPVFIGPRYHKFTEAVELVKNKGAFVVNNTNDFSEKVFALFTDARQLQESKAAASAFIQNNRGATAIIAGMLKI